MGHLLLTIKADSKVCCRFTLSVNNELLKEMSAVGQLVIDDVGEIIGYSSHMYPSFYSLKSGLHLHREICLDEITDDFLVTIISIINDLKKSGLVFIKDRQALDSVVLGHEACIKILKELGEL